MENMIFYDSITFVTDLFGVRFLFQKSFYSCLKQIKNIPFMTLHGPNWWHYRFRHRAS